jgi:autotransporter translocation and assembly factor TamB
VTDRVLDLTRRTFKIAAVLAVGSVLLFLGLTRTQVGRDQLRNTLEYRFSETFTGRLTIGELRGNLVQTLFARDVRLYAPDGQLVAHVDSVIARPRWSDLFRRSLSVGHVTLIRPSLTLSYDADGTWNLTRTFRRAAPRSPDVTPWRFTSGDLVIQEGRVQTRRAHVLPPLARSGWLWDYANARLGAVNLQATVEWLPDFKLIDILAATTQLKDENLPVDLLQGQLVIDSTGYQLSEGRLTMGGSDLRVSGRFQPPTPSALSDAPSLALTLSESRFAFDELRSVLPWLPLADTMRAHLDVRGPLSDLILNVDTLTRGQSLLRGAASVQGLPDALTLDATLRESRLATTDLRAIWPDFGASPLDTAGVLAVEADVQGSLASLPTPQETPFDASATFELGGRPGHLTGALAAARSDDGAIRLDLEAAFDTLNLAAAWSTLPLSTRLRGQLSVEGHGVRMDSLEATATLSLGSSTVAGRTLDTLTATLRATPEQLAASLTARPDRGAVRAVGTLMLDDRRRYRGRMQTTGLDLGPLLGVDTLRTALSTEAVLTGAGWPGSPHSTSIADLRLQVRDTSTVRLGSTARRLPPHQMQVAVRPSNHTEPRLRIAGDAFALTLDGPVTSSLLATATRTWSQAGMQWVRRRLLTAPSPPDERDGNRSLAEFGTALSAQDLDALTLRLTLDLRDPTLVAGYTPFLPPLPPLSAEADAYATPTAFRGSVRIDQGALRTPALRLDQLRATASVRATRPSSDVPPRVRGTLDVTADTLRGGISFPAPSLTARLTPDTLALQLRTNPDAEAGALLLDADFAFQEGGNQLALRDFSARVRQYTWTLAQAATITVSGERIAVPALTFTRQEDDVVQRISLAGAYSQMPADTLSMRLSSVDIAPIAELLSAPLRLDGTATGALALSRSPRPTLAGRLRLDTLAVNDRVVGTLVASSTFVPGTPDLHLRAAVQPLATDSTHLKGRPVTRNDLAVSGTARLPGTHDAGRLDLAFDVARADAFFFEDLFRNLVARSDGALQGSGTIRGTLQRPVFGGTFSLDGGEVVIPRFGLRYEAEGTARVDADGITLDDVRVADRTGGAALVNGRLLFNEYRHLSFDLTATLDDFEIIDVPRSQALPFYGQIWASGAVTLTGPVFDATLQASDAVTHPESELFIPISETEASADPGFIVFANEESAPPRREQQPVSRSRAPKNRRPRTFIEGLSMDLNITARPGSRVHLVIDPLLGDVINAVGSGRVQLQLQDDEFSTFGTFNVTAGDYLFTAGEVFVRRFQIDEGVITWDGDPADALLNIDAAYRTRASRAGLPEEVQARLQPLIPVIVQLEIRGRTTAPLVDLSLAIERGQREALQEAPYLETLLNQPDRSTEYATSVLLTNSFLLTTGGAEGDVLTGSAFNSVSQLVASQLNRYLAQVAPNLDLTLGVQGDETINELDVTAGLALRLLDERLVIRGEGVYRGLRQDAVDETQQALQGEFVVEVRLTPNVSVEVFYRRESDILSESVLTSTTGAGLSYQTRFPTWQRLFRRLLPAASKTPATPSDTTSGSQ